jgi:hypothetical protein
MNTRTPYHILNIAMIAGGVGFILNMLNLVDFLMQVKIIEYLGLIGTAVILKLAYGWIKPNVKDPITFNHLARKFFYLGMIILAAALLMRKYQIPYYNILLYLDIIIQCVALGISFSLQPDQNPHEEILDA